MPDPSSAPTSLVMRVVYEELPDMIGIETCVIAHGWRAATFAYAGPASLRESAVELLTWSSHPVDQTILEIGADRGIGWVCLRWYPVDRAGHLACHVQMAKPSATGSRAMETWRVSLELPTEPWSVEQFARQLAALATKFEGEAILNLE